MKPAKRSLLFIFILTCCFFSLIGQTLASLLGPLNGSVLIGKPLDVNLTATNDESSVIKNSCIQANVVFGERSIPVDRIVIGTQAGALPGETRVRIQSLVVIDEPVVTITISESCQQKSTKSYVLFAELQNSVKANPTDATDLLNRNSARSTGIQNAPALLKQKPATGTNTISAVLKESANKLVTGSTKTPVDKKARTIAASQIPKNSTRKPLSKTDVKQLPGISRLQLQPLDFFSDAPLNELKLRTTPELDLAPSPNRLDRNAAISLWQSLNTQPQDIESDKQKLQSLQSENLRLESEKNQTNNATLDLTNQLERARSEQFSNVLVWSLLVLLVLLVVILLVVINHYRKLRNSLEENDKEDIAWLKPANNTTNTSVSKNQLPSLDEIFSKPFNNGHTLNTNEAQVIKNNTLFSRSKGEQTTTLKTFSLLDSSAIDKTENKTYATHSDIDLNNLFGNDSGYPKPIQTKSSSPGFLATMPVEIKINPTFLTNEYSESLSVDEIFDVHQKADFFVSLGDFDNAILSLKNHISENSERISAVAYLDLFDLYHILGKRLDYDSLRDQFNKAFNVKVPEFNEYKTISVGLEMYPIAMSRIELLWPTQEALVVIEKLIFDKPKSPNTSFTLEAYRDLLLLYAIAKKIIAHNQDYLDYSMKFSVDKTEEFLSTEQSKKIINLVDIDLNHIQIAKPDLNKNTNLKSSNLIDFDN